MVVQKGAYVEGNKAGWLLVNVASKIDFLKKSKKVINMSWELKNLNFMDIIFTNLTSDLAGNKLNEPKQTKSTTRRL